MKLIEAMKQVKDLQKKAEDLRSKVKDNCALSSMDTPLYGTQAEQANQISEWIQAHSDILKEILRLRTAIQRTNLSTSVTIDLGDNQVTKTIAEWIHRRRDLAKEEMSMWNMLTDRNIREGMAQSPSGTPIEIKIVRFYDPRQQDSKKDLYSREPSIIDARLEVINAITDLVE